MKKIFLTFFILFFLIPPLYAEVLMGSTSYDEIFKGFFGTWHVTSKIVSTNNYSKFNPMSVDIWNLSGQNNVLILENTLTGAKSAIRIEDDFDNLDGKHLKFSRTKEYRENNFKYIHKETPEFMLDGDTFRGYDTFSIEKYDKNNNLISKDVVKYKVIGQKIAGD